MKAAPSGVTTRSGVPSVSTNQPGLGRTSTSSGSDLRATVRLGHTPSRSRLRRRGRAARPAPLQRLAVRCGRGLIAVCGTDRETAIDCQVVSADALGPSGRPQDSSSLCVPSPHFGRRSEMVRGARWSRGALQRGYSCHSRLSMRTCTEPATVVGDELKRSCGRRGRNLNTRSTKAGHSGTERREQPAKTPARSLAGGRPMSLCQDGGG
jgi:hypothetical protein